MYLVKNISADSKQKHSIILPSNGKIIELTLEYSPMQYGWFGKIKYEDFELSGIRICTSPNMLRQFSKLIPFGLACLVTDHQEPVLQEDFSSERAKIYVLSSDEVDEVEDLISG